ncbi:hypothetical protein HYU15_02260 [Candidatus Woesearchaeota archaeon]|nr:hypothetical protein [Candidatus Woesearchaeota archaeon]
MRKALNTIAIRNETQRILAAIIVTIASYLVLILALKPVIVPQQGGMMAMMSFANPNYITLNILALLMGVAAGLAAYLLTTPVSAGRAGFDSDRELQIIKRALSADEKALIDEVQKAGKITQDSLRFRLGWSKAKISTITTNLDRMGLVQRERQGKTYNVFLGKNLK